MNLPRTISSHIGSCPHPSTATFSICAMAPAAPATSAQLRWFLWSATWVGHAAILSLEGEAYQSAAWEERHHWIVICPRSPAQKKKISCIAAHQSWHHLPLPFSVVINMLQLAIDWFQAAGCCQQEGLNEMVQPDRIFHSFSNRNWFLLPVYSSQREKHQGEKLILLFMLVFGDGSEFLTCVSLEMKKRTNLFCVA